jgi:nucleoside-diphosphate-sugar epimerase
MWVLLTGGTGFIGLRLAQRLLAAGHGVRAVVRPMSRAAPLTEAGAEVEAIGLRDPRALSAALEGMDVVVHAAGGGVMRRPEDLEGAHVTTTRVLAEAARDRRPRVLFLSSLAAQGPAGLDAPATEADGPAPRSTCGRAKRAAERALPASGLDVAILRPPAVYGPGDPRLRPLFRAARRGWLP